jgi:hypothetical protein
MSMAAILMRRRLVVGAKLARRGPPARPSRSVPTRHVGSAEAIR